MINLRCIQHNMEMYTGSTVYHCMDPIIYTGLLLTKYLAVMCFLFVLAVSPAIVSTIVLLLVAKCTAGCIISQ